MKDLLKQVAFRIVCNSGKKKAVRGYKVAPGLVVHRNGPTWYVTHLVSGIGICSRQGFSSRANAISYVQKLLLALPGIDWLANEDVIDKEVSKRITTYFKGAGGIPKGDKLVALEEMLTDSPTKAKERV